MDGMLSQDEINALLSGMNAGSSDPQPDPQPAATEEILTDIEKDAIGEIANISMGTSATTLYSLVNRKVNITTPTVSIANWKNFLDEQEKPCVFIQIKYDNNYKPIKINKYDNAKVNYRSEEDAKKYPYIINERNIFNDSFTRINDYYSGDNNFKICLLCYVKKECL